MEHPIENSLDRQIRDAVVEAFLETGAALDTNEIAARLGWSPSKVRRIMVAAHGCVDGLEAWQDHRASHSRNYSSMVSGSHKVWTFSPSKETLREMIVQLRAAR